MHPKVGEERVDITNDELLLLKYSASLQIKFIVRIQDQSAVCNKQIKQALFK